MREEILLAVNWGDQRVLQSLLAKEADWATEGSDSNVEARYLKGLALEAALLQKDFRVVSCLLEFGAEAAHVNPVALFKRSAPLVRFDRETLSAGDGGVWATGAWDRVLAKLVDGCTPQRSVESNFCQSFAAPHPPNTNAVHVTRTCTYTRHYKYKYKAKVYAYTSRCARVPCVPSSPLGCMR